MQCRKSEKHREKIGQELDLSQARVRQTDTNPSQLRVRPNLAVHVERLLARHRLLCAERLRELAVCHPRAKDSKSLKGLSNRQKLLGKDLKCKALYTRKYLFRTVSIHQIIDEERYGSSDPEDVRLVARMEGKTATKRARALFGLRNGARRAASEQFANCSTLEFAMHGSASSTQKVRPSGEAETGNSWYCFHLRSSQDQKLV